MFTGLVQALGTIESLSDGYARIRYRSQNYEAIARDLAVGDSVAVDGICLTVETILAQGFVASVSPETLARSTLGRPSPTPTSVNLEGSLRVGSKLGGHFVTGHVDGIGCLESSVLADNSWEMTFTAPPSLEKQWSDRIARYIVPKGSIAVNGISLTVADCDPESRWFKVAVIPHTYAETNLQELQPGSWVNLEGDILGKYVEKFLHYGKPNSNGGENRRENGLETISPEFLSEHGYL
ncbi:riboflavin synthase [Baaleninema sp.]|uniref:riboflavin synthase n=1 Tax=Baaleninema sp. TaxID=3101197 RepID=UPI003D057751